MHGLLWCGKHWPLYCGKVAVQHAYSDTVGFCSAQKKLEIFARIITPALSFRRHGSQAKVLPARLPHPVTCPQTGHVPLLTQITHHRASACTESQMPNVYESV